MEDYWSVNSTELTDQIETEGISPTDEESNSGFHYLYIFAPLVSIEIILTIGSNAILVALIMQFCRTCTSLNIYLFSICAFNLILLYNQVAMIVVIFKRGFYIPTFLCRLSIVTRNMSMIGIFMTHLVLSYDRYSIAKSPLVWTVNRKKAWIYTAAIWIGSFTFAIFDCLLYFKDVSGDYASCLWTNTGTCSRPYKLGMKVAIVVSITIATVVIVYLHAKTSQELNANEIDKEFKLSSSSEVSRSKRQKTVPERAVLSLAIVFGIHIVSQLPLDIYNLIRYIVAIGRNEEVDNLPHAILFLLTCVSFITASTPLILMLINQRLKVHVKKYIPCTKKDNIDPEIILKHLSAEMPIPKPPLPLPKPKSSPNDPTIFLGGRAKQYVTKKLRISVTQRPQRVSSQSVAFAAINAGLVLSAAGHHGMLNNFFSEDTEEEMANVAKQLDTLYLF